jgi:hypothetical protein
MQVCTTSSVWGVASVGQHPRPCSPLCGVPGLASRAWGMFDSEQGWGAEQQGLMLPSSSCCRLWGDKGLLLVLCHLTRLCLLCAGSITDVAGCTLVCRGCPTRSSSRMLGRRRLIGCMSYQEQIRAHTAGSPGWVSACYTPCQCFVQHSSLHPMASSSMSQASSDSQTLG